MKQFLLICAGILALSTPAVAQNDLAFRAEAALAGLGYQPGVVDGIIDQATYNAIFEYQRDRSFPETGGLDLAALEAMEAEVRAQAQNGTAAPAPAPEVATVPSSVLPIVRPSPDNLAAQALYDEFGIRPAMVEWVSSSGNEMVSVLFEEIRPDSPAEMWGLASGSVVLFSPDERRFRGFMSLPTNVTSVRETSLMSSVFEQYLTVLRNPEDYVIVSVADLETASRLLANGGAELRTFSVRSLPQIHMQIGVTADNPQRAFVEHLGFDLSEDYVVVEVIPNTPASIAGVQVGDVWGGRIGNGGFSTSSWSRAALLERASQQLERRVGYGPLDFVFLRDGVEQEFPFPPIRFGETFSGPTLGDSEAPVFELLPSVLQEFYAFVYLGDFRLANDYQMYVFDTFFNGSGVALVTNLIGTSDDFRARFERSRGRGIFSQYILIKTNALGLCDDPGTDIRVEQERYEVWVDQYGAEVSQRREIEPRVFEFTVPTRWAGVLSEEAPMGEARAWRDDILAFVNAAGGCDSPILTQLENNMISYLRTGY